MKGDDQCQCAIQIKGNEGEGVVGRRKEKLPGLNDSRFTKNRSYL